MARLAHWVLGHRTIVLLAWLGLAIAGGVSAPHTVSNLSYDFNLPGKQSTAANERILRTFHSGGHNNPIVLSATVPPGRRATDPTSVRDLASVEARIAKVLPGARTASYASTHDAALVGRDGRTTALVVYPVPVPGASPYASSLQTLRTALSTSTIARAPIRVSGVDALQEATGSGRRGVIFETLLGGLGALIVLALVFGSFLALIPLLIATLSILTTFLLVGLLTTVTDVSFIVEYLIALIGLGVAIDYSLLVVTRWREALGKGADGPEAVVAAMTTAGRAVSFSGVTVGVSLVSLLLLPVPFLRSVGITGLLIPLVSVAASVTVLPVFLLWFGPRLAWPNRRSTDPHSRLWHRVATLVRRAPVPAAVLAAGLLIVLAIPAFSIRLASADPKSLASTGPAAQAYAELSAAGIPVGIFQPVQVLVTGPEDVGSRVSGIPGMAHVLSPQAWQRGQVRLVDVWTTSSATSDAGASAVKGIVGALERSRGVAIGGTPAADRDFVSSVYGNLWLVLTLVGVLTFLLLARAFRSILLPIKALVLNALSIGAAYGVAVFIWQDGHFTETLFGNRPTGAITTWVPIAVFAFIFGLSMDYEVFILSRMREVWDETGSNPRAVDEGVATTGRLVTSAALILFLAFVALGTVNVTDVKTFATALGAGIALDALVVRTILTPALVVLFGRWNWWLPRWAGGRPPSGPSTPDRRLTTAGTSARD